MIEMTFTQGGELMQLRIQSGNIEIKGKMSGYCWIDFRDLNFTERNQLKKKYGEQWYQEFVEAEEMKEKMSDEEIGLDLKKDMQKAGWRMVKQNGTS